MTFADWVEMSKELYREESPLKASKKSAMGLRNGAFRRVGQHIGRSIWERDDWDVLVILDACRYDLWDEVAGDRYDLPTGNHVWSNASCSIDWILRNIKQHPERQQSLSYVTSNPFADHSTKSARSADLADENLGHFLPLYKTHWQDLHGGDIATVPPEDVTDHAIQTWRERSDLGIDRMIVHYMQPHEPYITKPEWGDGDSKLLSNLVDSDKEAGSSVWPRVENGEVPVEELWQANVDNLQWVLDDVVDRLLENMAADVRITSDHGNALGEWGEWHHPPGAIGPAVRKVPWIAVEGADNRAVNPGVDVQKTGTQNQTGADERLKALGYL